jgi:DNA polymerase-4/protein ImuB
MSDLLSRASRSNAHALSLSGLSRAGRPGGGSSRTARKGSRSALCLWLPTFELRLELVRSPELDQTSVALLSPEEGARRPIWQVSERAFEAGVRPGQLISQAVSLCPSLTLLEPDPAHYDAAMENVLETLTSLTPVVEPSPERGKVFLGMDGLGRLYGSPKNQVRTVLRALFQVLPRPLVAAMRAGWAPGVFGSWVAAARSRPGQPVIVSEAELANFLSGCPVAALPVEEEMLTRLERLSIHTLGDLTRLPEPALMAQFGQDGRDALAWATGRRIDPVRPWHRPRPIRVSLDFPNPVGQTDLLHNALDRLLDRALSRPARKGRSVQEIRIVGRLEGGRTDRAPEHADGAPVRARSDSREMRGQRVHPEAGRTQGTGSWVVEAVTREPTASARELSSFLRSRIALSPPPRAVEGLTLEFVAFGPPSTQEDLFQRTDASGRTVEGRTLADGQIPPSLRDAVRELTLRLGDSPLYRVVELDPWSRIPERRHALLRFDA